MYEKISFIDLHIHSKYSIACSKNADIYGYSEMAKLKGIDYIGTGDIFVNEYLNDIKKKLKNIDFGVYKYNNIKFFLSIELSFIYKDGERTKKVHLITVFSDIKYVYKVKEQLKEFGKLDNNGRPIVKMNLRTYIDILKNIDQYSIVIPAHIWTPHFGIMGYKSGYDSIAEAMPLKYISAIETGLSSDPFMNTYIEELSDIPIVSFSDAHSPQRLGREITMIEGKELNIKTLKEKLESNNIFGTIEFYPEEGKYFARGHRKCNFSTLNKKITVCPICNKTLTEGVFTRIKSLSSKQAYKYKKRVFYSFPLELIVQYIKGTVKVKHSKGEIMKQLSSSMPEMYLKTFASIDEIEKQSKYPIGLFIQKMRQKKVKMIYGYDGLYGKILEEEK